MRIHYLHGTMLFIKFTILSNDIFLQETSHEILKNCSLSVFFNGKLDPQYSLLNFLYVSDITVFTKILKVVAGINKKGTFLKQIMLHEELSIFYAYFTEKTR